MNHWLANSVKNLVPLSKAQSFQEALSEWFFTGEVDDYEGEDASIICELCEHPDLVHHFHIKNAHTERSLLVGSSCILKFQQIEVRDSQGRAIVDPVMRRRALDEALRAKIIDTSLGPLRRLWKVARAKRGELKFLAGEIKRDVGLTPRQLNDLLRYLEDHGIQYAAKLYKVRMRSFEAANECASLTPAEFKRMAPALSASQLARARKLRNEA